MVNPVLDDKDQVLGKIEKGKEQLGGIEDRIFARGQEAGKTAIVKELCTRRISRNKNFRFAEQL